MRVLIGLAMLISSASAWSHELDSERTVAGDVPAEALLPVTTVVRVNKNNPADVAVVHLNRMVKKGEQIDSLNFKDVALNSEIRELNFDSSNEKDMTSSTSSWSFGYYRGPYGGGAYLRGPYRSGYVGYRRPYYPNYYPNWNNYGYYRPYYTVNNNCGYYGNGCYYNPTYYVGNYSYAYSSYYSYSNSYYNYNCYTW